jgi:hypothetical protein
MGFKFSSTIMTAHEELNEELSFPVYRRVATMIFVPAESGSASTVEMVTITHKTSRCRRSWT